MGVVFALTAAVGLRIALPAGAIGRPLDLATMTERAGNIVVGRIANLRVGPHPKYHNVAALYVTVKVEEMLKGAPAETFTFMQFSGLMPAEGSAKGLSAAQSLPDVPAYRVGEELVLFLYPPSKVGFTSPVGGSQGKFLVRRQPGEPTTVVSEGGNRELAVNGPLSSRLTPDQQRLLREPGSSLDLKIFRATVKRLMSKPK